MRFQDLVESDRFVIIAELESPKGTETAELCALAAALKGRAHAVYVPDMGGAIMRMGSLAAGRILQEEAVEPIINLNCRDRNRLALQADALGAAALGLHNIFISRGDDISSGDHIDARPVYDLDVLGLIAALRRIERGIDLAGNDLAGTARFCIGAEVNAGLAGAALDVEVMEMEKRVRAGVQYFFTQPLYDLDVLAAFLDKTAHLNVPVFPQVCILKSVGMARFMARHVEGVAIPDAVIERLSRAADKTKAGIDLAAETITRLRGLTRGVLLTVVGGQERLARVLDQFDALHA